MDGGGKTARVEGALQRKESSWGSWARPAHGLRRPASPEDAPFSDMLAEGMRGRVTDEGAGAEAGAGVLDY